MIVANILWFSPLRRQFFSFYFELEMSDDLPALLLVLSADFFSSDWWGAEGKQIQSTKITLV